MAHYLWSQHDCGLLRVRSNTGIPVYHFTKHCPEQTHLENPSSSTYQNTRHVQIPSRWCCRGAAMEVGWLILCAVLALGQCWSNSLCCHFKNQETYCSYHSKARDTQSLQKDVSLSLQLSSSISKGLWWSYTNPTITTCSPTSRTLTFIPVYVGDQCIWKGIPNEPLYLAPFVKNGNKAGSAICTKLGHLLPKSR